MNKITREYYIALQLTSSKFRSHMKLTGNAAVETFHFIFLLQTSDRKNQVQADEEEGTATQSHGKSSV
jgi:hypothetical protein